MRSLIVLFCLTYIVEAQQNPTCLKDWTYFAKSNKCFKVFGGLNDPIQTTIWSQAEQYCKKFNGGHLASFHSDDEITFVVGLSQQAGWDDGGWSPVHVGHTYTGNYKWEWTDGSSWTYTKWWDAHYISINNTFQAQYPRGYLQTQGVWASTMWTGSGGNLGPFACQMPPSKEG